MALQYTGPGLINAPTDREESNQTVLAVTALYGLTACLNFAAACESIRNLALPDNHFLVADRNMRDEQEMEYV